MDNREQSATRALVGRFRVRLDDGTQDVLAANEVLDLLDHSGPSIRDIFQIHRVDDTGRMELAGVAIDELQVPGAVVLKYSAVADARRDYDVLLTAANAERPPCRIEMHLARILESSPQFGLVLLIPNICTDGVLIWLGRHGISIKSALAGHEGLDHYAKAQDILTTTLEP